MPLTAQEMFDCIDNLDKNKLVFILEGKKEDNRAIYFKIHMSNSTYYLDSYNDLDDPIYADRTIEDITDLAKFKVTILTTIRKYNISNISIE
ncbi:hypothetical protein [Wukongibacter baidiensis]